MQDIEICSARNSVAVRTVDKKGYSTFYCNIASFRCTEYTCLSKEDAKEKAIELANWLVENKKCRLIKQ